MPVYNMNSKLKNATLPSLRIFNQQEVLLTVLRGNQVNFFKSQREDKNFGTSQSCLPFCCQWMILAKCSTSTRHSAKVQWH